MNENNILSKLKEAISEQLDIEQENIAEESNFQKDLGADSLDITELIMQLEEKFGVEFEDEEAKKLATVGNVKEFIVSKTKE